MQAEFVNEQQNNRQIAEWSPKVLRSTHLYNIHTT